MTGERRLRVLNLVANRWWTGSADPALRLTLALRVRGHHALLGLAPGDKFEAKAREAGVEPVEGLHLDARSGPAAVLSDLRRLRRLVRDEGLDVIHVHHSHDHWLGWWSHGRSALVRSYHNERSVRRAWPTSRLYRVSQALVAVSRGVEEKLIAAGAPAQSVHRVGGVVDTARFAPDSRGAAKIREEFQVASAPLIGCVARLAAGRGHEVLLEGFRLLRRERPDARLLLIGKGERRQALEAAIKSLGLEESALLAGYRDTDLPAVLHALDIFVLLGTGSDESGRAALEAMAAGRPVVAARVGALPEAVIHGETGILLEQVSSEHVAAALRQLIEHPHEARAMGQAGHRRALGRFSPDSHARRFEEIYMAALASTRQ